MDLHAFSISIISSLIPFLAKNGEVLLGKVITESENRLKDIWEKVKERLARDDDAKVIADNFEKKPESKTLQAALISILEEKLNTDHEFLQNMLALMKNSGSTSDVIEQKIDIKGNAKVGNITVVGKMDGNLTINEPNGSKRKKQ